MAGYVNQRTEDEEVLFACFGTLDGKDKATTYLVKEGETIEGLVTAVKDSPTYKKIFMLKVKGEEKPILVLGKTDLVDKMGYGNLVTDLVAEVNDLVKITFVNKTKTQKKYDWYNFEVAIKKA
jgi:hypothetical protein